MRTVQITLDESLVQEVDQVVKRLGTTRSAFAQEALRAALARVYVQELEDKHRRGYRRKPVDLDVFSHWENEQVWGG